MNTPESPVSLAEGYFCHTLAEQLFPICRSITGCGVRETLDILATHMPGLRMHEVPTGTEVFDWTVPEEWEIRDAYIEDEKGQRILDFKQHNLHVIGYSAPVDDWFDLGELDKHLYSLPQQPDAIPYITSYYARRWGFCLTHAQRKKLQPGKYHAVVDSSFKQGSLTYADLVLPGESDREVLLSTYVCHPSMANNELSGPVVTTALVRWLMSLEKRHYTYRIVIIPETIGSITYLSRHLDTLKSKVVAGYNVTCIGDERAYSFLPSRMGNTLADQAARHALSMIAPDYKSYNWLARGGDERQYNAPGVDLPVAVIMRSKFADYPEYHTSLDDLSFVTPRGLQGGFNVLRRTIEVLEANQRLKMKVLCEPQLGKRGLYPSLSTKESSESVAAMMNMITYCDGTKTLLEVAEIIGEPVTKLASLASQLIEADIMEVLRLHEDG